VSGAQARANPFRFSTKFTDDESDLVYYGYRYYNSSIGRWANRDPKQEKGGANLYEAIRNSPLNGVDFLGLSFKVHISINEDFSTEIPPQSDQDANDPSVTIGLTAARKSLTWAPSKCEDTKIQLSDFAFDGMIKTVYVEDYTTASSVLHRNVDGSFDTVISHERKHQSIYEAQFDFLVGLYAPMYRKCVCRPCFEAWETFAKLATQYIEVKTGFENDDFDVFKNGQIKLKERAAKELLEINRLAVELQAAKARMSDACGESRADR
jgi:RHS repeat-associated protein